MKVVYLSRSRWPFSPSAIRARPKMTPAETRSKRGQKPPATLSKHAHSFATTKPRFRVKFDWANDPEIHVVLTTGGTGLTHRDVTPEAVRAVMDKRLKALASSFVGLATNSSQRQPSIPSAGALVGNTYVRPPRLHRRVPRCVGPNPCLSTR